jgi:cytochrome c oxidase subunit 2
MMNLRSPIYLYELLWILPSLALPVGMFAILLVTTFGAQVHLPGVEGRVNPTQLATAPPFDQPGVVRLAPGRYEVRMIGQVWSFDPDEIHVPVGAEVTFVATSSDVVHGLFIPHTYTNIMLLPGQVARVTTHFLEPGTYVFLCHEYCGLNHHAMAGTIVVEPEAPNTVAGTN